MTNTSMPLVQHHQLGRVAYRTALQLQQQLVALRSAGAVSDTLVELEHPPTITLGNRADPANVHIDAAGLAAAGIDLVQTDRGGDVTYHAPGQIVLYPILKLSQHGGDVGRYVRLLEQIVIETLAAFQVTADRVSGLPGVWVDHGRRKICAIGVKLSASGVTSHGIALNVTTDLHGFGLIVPCGISDRGVTSLAVELGSQPSVTGVASELRRQFSHHFARELSGAPLPPEVTVAL
jgi:lipoyl(octanoyl) transferase